MEINNFNIIFTSKITQGSLPTINATISLITDYRYIIYIILDEIINHSNSNIIFTSYYNHVFTAFLKSSKCRM